MKLALLAVAGALVACGAHRGPGGDDTDAASATLQLTPANATIAIVDGQPQTEAYTVALIAPDGTSTDVTATAVFSVPSPAVGSWSGPSLTVSGELAGVTQVFATANGVTGSTPLTISVTNTRIEGSAPANAATLFGSATESSALAPTIVYPADGIIAPPNLGQFDVHWTSTQDDVFAVEVSNTYVDYTIYTTGTDASKWWTVLQPTEWAALASPALPLTLTVAGLNTATPTMKGTSAPQHVDVTTAPLVGGVYYWTTSAPQGVFRYDMSLPNVPPAPYFAAADNPGGANNCMGCHALSHDGTKFALTIDEAGGRGTVINVSDGTVLVPYASNPQYWDFATFNLDGSKLVTAQTGGGTGTMVLRATAGGAVLASIPNSPGATATHPELSADGTMLANVEESSPADDIEPVTGAIVVRTFDDATNTFGSIQTVLADGVGGLSSYYPSWSPDGQWLLVTRVSGSAYANVASSVWVVKADGTVPPIQLATADLTGSLEDSWARWAPFAETTDTGDSVFFLTFSSLRPFGVRLPTAGTPQIWMAPFFPSRAIAGQDPSGPAFRPPFQSVATHNHIAQWTQQVIAIE